MSIGGHLVELRSRLVKVSAAVVVGSVVGFIFHQSILAWLEVPYQTAVGKPLIFTTPTGAFSVAMRLSLFGGIILASPVIIYQLWRFVSPALTNQERRYVIPLSFVLALLFGSGVALGYWSLERGLSFLFGFGGDSLEPFIEAVAYLSFATRFILVFGFAFEFPVFMFAAAATGIVGSRALRNNRRWAVTAIVVIGAVITPSGDPLTLLLLSTPLYILYEITILAIRFILKK
jgi:sec-independent protein translocase protein TatC